MSGLVLRKDEGAIVTLTLNRPEKLNALSPELFLELRAHVDEIASMGDSVRCVILRGAGRSFCAGADIEALRAGVTMAEPEFRSETLERIGALQPVKIAAVHGHCFTGGLELALTADIIIASEDAKFCDTHARLGILPRWGLSARLPRRIGPAAAKRISLTTEPLDAPEALRIGLCDYVAQQTEFEEFVHRTAAKVARLTPSCALGVRHLYEHSLTVPLAEALAYERAYSKPPAPQMD
ncbi:enoyl-CoA hydratase/isomerase family protein [Terrarubrum flagellatum]|uniref:enoyl-CoA hydratase/isomerase family protein n=1 Tax=Terrirubrum flagellatum TaxID=2895980 RepID=UPI0031451745